MLSDRLTLAQRKRFDVSSEKYADGYTQLNLFNEADPNVPEPDLEDVHPGSYRRKNRSGKKEEDLSSFGTTEVIEYKLTGADRYCPECNTKYKVVTKETVKRLKFVPARFEVIEEVTFVYSCPKCGLMKEELLRSNYLHGDESRTQVIDELDQKGSTQNWMWVYLTDGYSGSPQMVLFQYERTRAGYHPVEFLGDSFHGSFTCDEYQA